MVPFVDLKLQYKNHRDEFHEAIERVLENTAFILGKEVEDFEEHFARFAGTSYAAGVASGTDAIHLALRAQEIGSGDEVITAVNTFYATSAAIELAGAKPVFVDCDPETCLIDTEAVKEVITKKTRAIIPVHLYGQVVPMDEIMSLAEKHNIAVIEDACQSHGAQYKGSEAGSFGSAGAFSFYPGKNLGAFGDGGAVVTDSKDIYEKLLALRNYGSPKKYFHPTFGTNSRLDGVQAAVLNVKLHYLSEWNAARSRAAERYIENLSSCKSISLPARVEGSTHVYHLFVVQVSANRDQILTELAQRDIQCGIHYPIPLHQQEAYEYLGYHEGDFPNAENISKKIISLPMFPEITDAQIDYVCENLLDIIDYC